MTTPEFPRDPLPDHELILNNRMRKMVLFGVGRGIIELLADQDYTDAVLELASICESERRNGTATFLIDELAIGFVSRIDSEIYEDALVVQEILRPEMGSR